MVGYCQSQIWNEEKSLLCFSTHSFQNNRFHSLICDFCTIFVWDLIKVYVQYNVSISAAEDVQSWASREGLSNKIVQVLAEEGFASLDDIKDLSSDEVTEGFHRSKLLNFKKCRDLRKAIARMSNRLLPRSAVQHQVLHLRQDVHFRQLHLSMTTAETSPTFGPPRLAAMKVEVIYNVVV